MAGIANGDDIASTLAKLTADGNASLAEQMASPLPTPLPPTPTPEPTPVPEPIGTVDHPIKVCLSLQWTLCDHFRLIMAAAPKPPQAWVRRLRTYLHAATIEEMCASPGDPWALSLALVTCSPTSCAVWT
jgi:hypothetical protein